MQTAEPVGHILRAPRKKDAKAVAALLQARERADLGKAETRIADVRADWEALDPAQDAWVVEEPGGALSGYALVSGYDLVVAVHPEQAGRGLGGELRERAERHARARGARVVRQFIPAAAGAARAHLLDAGWWPAHHYFRMRIDLHHAPPAPDVLTRSLDPGRDTEEVWHLVQGAYAEVDGHLPQTLEGWRAAGPDKPGWDPRYWLLLHDARGIVGAALGAKGEAHTGVITAVAVAERARGRGHGRTLVMLLLDAFRAGGLRQAEAAAHGRTVAAARVFESAGMVAARRTERWEKVLGD